MQMWDNYQQKIAKDKSLLNLIGQSFNVATDMAKKITGNEVHNLCMRTVDTNLKRLYERVRLIGDGRIEKICAGVNGKDLSLTLYQRNLDDTYDLLVAHAMQTKEIKSTDLVGNGLTGVVVGVVAGVLTVNPFIGFAAGTAVTSAIDAKTVSDYTKQISDLLDGFLIDELIKRRYLKINANHELEF